MKRTRAVLIVGGSGVLGTQLCLRLKDHYKVFATFNAHQLEIPGVTYLPMEASDRDTVKRIIYTISPQIVVYIAGTNDAQFCEDNPRECDRVHSNGAVNIATTAGILQPRFVFVSNCYVFDGRKGNYKENDIVLPINNLGKAKLSSEKYFMGSSNYVVVRSSPVYSRGNGHVLSNVDRFRMAMDAGKKFEANNSWVQSYAPAVGLIDILVKLVDGGPRNTILHYGGLTKVTQYQFFRKFAERFGYNPEDVVPKDAEDYLDYSLNSTNTAKTLKIKPLLLEEGFDLFEKELVS